MDSINSIKINIVMMKCFICFDKIRNPTVCPNMHAFCENCIQQWLEKQKTCPTCRIQINEDNKFKPILGHTAIDSDTAIHFSNELFRRSQFLGLFESYENEIKRLQDRNNKLAVCFFL